MVIGLGTAGAIAGLSGLAGGLGLSQILGNGEGKKEVHATKETFQPTTSTIKNIKEPLSTYQPVWSPQAQIQMPSYITQIRSPEAKASQVKEASAQQKVSPTYRQPETISPEVSPKYTQPESKGIDPLILLIGAGILGAVMIFSGKGKNKGGS